MITKCYDLAMNGTCDHQSPHLSTKMLVRMTTLHANTTAGGNETYWPFFLNKKDNSRKQEYVVPIETEILSHIDDSNFYTSIYTTPCIKNMCIDANSYMKTYIFIYQQVL